ncbi:uncharacterized protein LOC127751317 isoform X2 [Frankliniella occidentalis]|uniref:Uncharacterized protein LOC127751317 isoform X2 n=1 Tax=Frankliniella occidentalis TaxID=133901 RepID=A0A9C6XU47_FRAOC|nr:uncharacterized protein LOC127751317 isoform X2 [Frankliniella occidentalis]
MDEELAVDALAFEQPMQEEINIEEPRGNRENGLRRAPGILQTPPLNVVTASPSVVLGAAAVPSPAGPSAAPSRPAPKPRDRDLQIQLELRCDLDLAPLAFLNKYQSDGEDAVEENVETDAPSTSKSRAGPSGGTRAWRRAKERVQDDAVPAPAPAPPSCALRIAFHCPLAIENRLPGVAYLSCHSG